jgi:hypothetical protein
MMDEIVLQFTPPSAFVPRPKTRKRGKATKKNELFNYLIVAKVSLFPQLFFVGHENLPKII